MKYKELHDLAYKEKYQKSKGESTFYKYGEQVVKIIGNRDIKAMTYKDILKVINAFRERGNTDSTIDRKMNTFRGVMSFGVDYGIIEEYHKPKIPTLDKTKPSDLFITLKDAKAFLNYFEMLERKMYIYFVLGYLYGSRVSNIITIDDSHIQGGYITWQGSETKNGEKLKLPMTENTKKLIQELKELGYFNNWNTDHIRYRFKKARDLLGLDEKYTLHMLRSSFATDNSMNGADDDVIMRAGGWNDTKSLKRYNKYGKEAEMLRMFEDTEKRLGICA